MGRSANTARPDVVLIGPTTLIGTEIRRELEERRFPLHGLTLMADGEEVGQITEFRGEARLVTAFDADLVERADIVFLGEVEGAARGALQAAARGSGTVIDVAGVLAGEGDSVINFAVNPDRIPATRPARIRCPHAAVQALSSALAALGGEVRPTTVDATVLTPVSERGEAGIQELYQQTTAILSFSELPREALSRQVAFNAIPHALLHRQNGWPDLNRRLEEEAASVLGLPATAVGIRAVLVPLFHGTAIAATARFDPAPPAGERARRLRSGSLATSACTPAELGESESIHVTDLGEGADGRVALWIIADNVRGAAARNGVRIAESLLGEEVA